MPRDKAGGVTSRNVVELEDNSLLIGFSDNVAHRDSIWRSYDGGQTWSEKYPERVESVAIGERLLPQLKNNPGNWPSQDLKNVNDVLRPLVFWESHLWQGRSNNPYSIPRVPHQAFPLPDIPPPKGTGDQLQRMTLHASIDLGRTWKFVRNFGYYDEMYPSILVLRDGRLLLTFTVRTAVSPRVPPLGVHAVLGRETEDGLEFDFEHDRILLDTKTPASQRSGGGYGPTIQLADDSLLTAYSHQYVDSNGRETRCGEIVRWRLPKSSGIPE